MFRYAQDDFYPDNYSYDLDNVTQQLSRLEFISRPQNNIHSRKPAKPRQVRQLPAPQKVQKNPSLFNMPRSVEKCYRNSFLFGRHIKLYISMDAYDPEFNMIEKMMPPSLLVTRINKVINPYLKMAFEFKRQFVYNNIQPRLLFHGTKLKYIDSICSDNFNWRFSGAEKGHRYGKGVNFAPRAKYASYFCDKTHNKVMILAEVLVSNITVGKEVSLVPPKGFDTTARENGDVLVKYYDAEFCPLYVIYFHKR